MPSFTDRVKSAWNAFNGRDYQRPYVDVGSGSSYRPDRARVFYTADASIVKAISTRIAIDVASTTLEHVRLDDERNYQETIKSPLNECLTLSANIDQTGRAFIQDAAESMFDEGVVAIVPTDITFTSGVIKDPYFSESYSIDKLRTGKIVEWYPQHVKVRLYNELNGRTEDVVLSKNFVAIIQNPLYSIMNEPNSTLQRLIRTYNDIDSLNAQSTSGKLDLIIQLPYVIKSDLKQQQAEQRRKLIEEQLTGSKYGIAYIDGTEKITQLNRPIENNLWNQAKDLEQRLFNQLGLTQSVFDGTADEATMINYQNRTVEPCVAAFADEMKRKFLSKTARSQGQSIIYFKDPFRLVPVSQMAEIADKFTRNEILSPNEIRAEIGYKPDKNPKSDELRNRNINQNTEEIQQTTELPDGTVEEEEVQGTPEEVESSGNSVEDIMKLLSGE
jgi:hypothetical protein